MSSANSLQNLTAKKNGSSTEPMPGYESPILIEPQISTNTDAKREEYLVA